METIHGAPSYILRTPEVALAVTQTAGHLAPVTFNLGALQAKPYSLSPWTPSQADAGLPALLRYLRGDFLCLPFGGQKQGPPHGDPANADWQLVAQTERKLVLKQQTTDTGAHVTKTLSLEPGQHAVYCEHLIENLEGTWNYGNHPVLDLSSVPAGAARVATSAFRFGSVYPGEFSNPASGEAGALRPSAQFTSLKSVAMKDGTFTDLSRYPARPGNDDLIMLVNAPATESQPFAWTAVTFPVTSGSPSRMSPTSRPRFSGSRTAVARVTPGKSATWGGSASRRSVPISVTASTWPEKTDWPPGASPRVAPSAVTRRSDCQLSKPPHGCPQTSAKSNPSCLLARDRCGLRAKTVSP